MLSPGMKVHVTLQYSSREKMWHANDMTIDGLGTGHPNKSENPVDSPEKEEVAESGSPESKPPEEVVDSKG